MKKRRAIQPLQVDINDRFGLNRAKLSGWADCGNAAKINYGRCEHHLNYEAKKNNKVKKEVL